MIKTCGGCEHSNLIHSQTTGDCHGNYGNCGCVWTNPTASYPIMMDEDTCCIDCGRSIPQGYPYVERFDCFMGERPDAFGEFDKIVELVCVYCYGE